MKNRGFYKKIAEHYKYTALSNLQVLSYQDLLQVPTLTKREKINLGPYHMTILNCLIVTKEESIKAARIQSTRIELIRNKAVNQLTDDEIDNITERLQNNGLNIRSIN